MILYFTGTGNSRACAKWLSSTLGDTCTDSFSFIRNGIAGEFTSQTPWVFVAPTYSWRLPRVFTGFLRASRLSGARDAYFVMTCGADIGAAARYNHALSARLGLRCRGTLPVGGILSLSRLSTARPHCTCPHQIIGTEKGGHRRAGGQMVEQNTPTGLAVAACPVVVQRQPQAAAQGVQPVIGQLGQQPAAHLAGAGVVHPLPPEEPIGTQAFGQH